MTWGVTHLFSSLLFHGFCVVGVLYGGSGASPFEARAWAWELDLDVDHPQAVIDRASSKVNI